MAGTASLRESKELGAECDRLPDHGLQVGVFSGSHDLSTTLSWTVRRERGGDVGVEAVASVPSHTVSKWKMTGEGVCCMSSSVARFCFVKVASGRR